MQTGERTSPSPARTQDGSGLGGDGLAQRARGGQEAAQLFLLRLGERAERLARVADVEAEHVRAGLDAGDVALGDEELLDGEHLVPQLLGLVPAARLAQ